MNANVSKLINTIGKNSPLLLSGLAIVGVGATVYFAVKGTVKATRDVDDMKAIRERNIELCEEEKMDITFKPIGKIDIVGQCWKYYIPTALSMSLTIACIVGAHKISAKRIAAVGALYAASETSLKQYKEAALRTVGEKKANDIQAKNTQMTVDKHPCSVDDIFKTGDGDVKVLDAWNGRYFYSSIEAIRSAFNSVKEEIYSKPFGVCNLNELYYYLRLRPSHGGDDIGWNTMHVPELRLGSALDEEGQPVVVMEFASGHEPTAMWLEQ